MVAGMNAVAIGQNTIFPPLARGIAQTIVKTIVAREQHAFRRSSSIRLRNADSAAHRPSRRQAVQCAGKKWDAEVRLSAGGLFIHAVGNDTRVGELEAIDDRSSLHVRRWEGLLFVRSGDGTLRLRATWCGTNGSIDLSAFDVDDETISDDLLRDIQRALGGSFGSPEDAFGIERVKHDDFWRSYPPDARA
jgi:hypothetical protein